MNLERRSWVSEIINVKELNRKRLDILLSKEFDYNAIIDHVNEILTKSYSDVIYIQNVAFRKLLESNNYENTHSFPLNVIMRQVAIDLEAAGYEVDINVTKSYDLDHDMEMVYPTLIIKLPGGIE